LYLTVADLKGMNAGDAADQRGLSVEDLIHTALQQWVGVCDAEREPEMTGSSSKRRKIASS